MSDSLADELPTDENLAATLHYLSTVTAETSPYVQPQQPTGKECRGYAFVIPSKAINFIVRPPEGDNYPIPIVMQAAAYRWCIWDGRVSGAQENGEECEHCKRIIRDNDLGEIPKDYLKPQMSYWVWLENVSQWALCAVVMEERS